MPQSLLSFLWIGLIRLGDKCCSQTIRKNTEINECFKALQHPGRTIIYTVNGIKIKTDFIFFYNSLLDKLSGCDGFEMEKGWGWEAVQPVKCLLHKNEGLSSGPRQSTELGIMVLINKHSNGIDRGKKTPGTHRWLPRTHGHTLAYVWACIQTHVPRKGGKGRHFATWCFGRPRIRWLQRTLVHPFLFACLPSFFVIFFSLALPVISPTPLTAAQLRTVTCSLSSACREKPHWFPGNSENSSTLASMRL